jgi:peptidoglycan-associated lipoprotein
MYPEVSYGSTQPSPVHTEDKPRKDSKMKKTLSIIVVLALSTSAQVANADYTFGTPTNLGPTVNSFYEDWGPSITGNGLELYFESARPDGEGTYDIWVSTRATKEDDWGAPTNLGPQINTPDWQTNPCISADGLELYFVDWDLWVVRRATVSDPWGEPEKDSLININTSNAGMSPGLSSDGLSLFLSSWDDWLDLYVSTRPTKDDLWSEPVSLGPTVNGVNSTWLDRDPAISADGLVLIFSSDRDGGYGGRDLWMTRRSTIDGPWSEPVNLGPTINSGGWEAGPDISADGRSLLFCAGRDGGYGDFDIWQASIDPVIDFNGDGSVDAADLLALVLDLGTDNTLYDIGPMPWGDGVVDIEDVKVFTAEWEKAIAADSEPTEP